MLASLIKRSALTFKYNFYFRNIRRWPPQLLRLWHFLLGLINSAINLAFASGAQSANRWTLRAINFWSYLDLRCGSFHMRHVRCVPNEWSADESAGYNLVDYWQSPKKEERVIRWTKRQINLKFGHDSANHVSKSIR